MRNTRPYPPRNQRRNYATGQTRSHKLGSQADSIVRAYCHAPLPALGNISLLRMQGPLLTR